MLDLVGTSLYTWICSDPIMEEVSLAGWIDRIPFHLETAFPLIHVTDIFHSTASFEIFVWFNERWHYLGGDRGNRPEQLYSFPRIRTFSV